MKTDIKKVAKTIVKTGKNIDVKILCFQLINACSDDQIKTAIANAESLVS
tara:strand:- start:185 stop:334 length:150 start_codon:yes stop_codon:yes gene_type:complete